jgi:hypothetical protein
VNIQTSLPASCPKAAPPSRDPDWSARNPNRSRAGPGNREWHHDAVTDFQLAVYPRANLDHFAHRLVADHIAALHLRNDAVEDVEVGAAYGAGRHLDDGVARMLDFRVGDRFAADVVLAVPDEGFHSITPQAAP